MVKFALGALLATLVSSSAFSADMPVKAPPPVTAATWTGWYAGIVHGFGYGHATQTDNTPFSSGRYATWGSLTGATIGFNWQAGSLVLGAEADLSMSAIKGSTRGPTAVPCFSNYCGSDIRTIGTLRSRVGYAAQNWMPYVTGGLAYALVHGEEGVVIGGGAGQRWVTGYTFGGGVETMLAPGWSAKVEYLYLNLGKNRIFTDFAGGAFFARESLDVSAHTFRVGVNHHFGAQQAVAPVAYHWAGFYVGANVGTGWGTGRYTNVTNTTAFGDMTGQSFTHRFDGGVGGIQVGHNWQTNNIVYGLEGSLNLANLSGRGTPAFGAALDDAFTTRVNSLALFSGRLGVAMNNWLLYGKGGYAGGNVRASVRDAIVPTGGGGSTAWHHGFNLGIGIEAGIARNWTVGAQYDYISLASGRHQLGGGAGSYRFNVALRPINLLTARVNYRFN